MRNGLLVLTLVAAALAGCQKAEEIATQAGGKPGARYVGVGIYGTGRIWGELAQPRPATPDTSTATLDDDDHVIVVLDTATGELRQCGNLSGHCLTSNPWAKTTLAQPAPAKMLKHLEDLLREDQMAGEPAAKPPQK